MAQCTLAAHQHGKNSVRLGRVWREGAVHHMVEWTVFTMLESDMAHAFLTPSNAGMTATDTQRNMVYVVGKKMSDRCTAEEFAIALAKQFVETYPLVSKAKIRVEQAPWERVTVMGQPHYHGFAQSGTEIRTAYVTYDKSGNTEVTSGFKNLKVLKTTQSGYEGFLKDQYTLLKDTNERIVATSVTCTFKYNSPTADYEGKYQKARAAALEAFYGCPKEGVYSPSVQYTMYQMGQAMLAAVPQIDSIFFNMPNLHFIPTSPPTATFKDDVYTATSEPSGAIECVVTRAGRPPHARL